MSDKKLEVTFTGAASREIPDGLENMLTQLLEVAQVNGEVTVHVTAAVKGTAHQQGFRGASIRGVHQGTAVQLRLQPGGNSTSRDLLVMAPHGITADEFARRLREALDQVNSPNCPTETLVQTETRIRTRMDQVVAELGNLNSSLQQFSLRMVELDQEEAQILEQRRELEVEKRRLDEEYRRQVAKLTEEISSSHNQQRGVQGRREKVGQEKAPVELERTQLDEERQLLELELEDLESRRHQEFEARMKVVAEEMGISYDKAVAMIKGR